jgi:hypothetical protein
VRSDVEDEARPPEPQESGVGSASAAIIEGKENDELDCAVGHEAGVISLLAEEYRALRAELTQRLTARMQVVGFVGAVSALLAGLVAWVSEDLIYTSPSLFW